MDFFSLRIIQLFLFQWCSGSIGKPVAASTPFISNGRPWSAVCDFCEWHEWQALTKLLHAHGSPPLLIDTR